MHVRCGRVSSTRLRASSTAGPTARPTAASRATVRRLEPEPPSVRATKRRFGRPAAVGLEDDRRSLLGAAAPWAPEPGRPRTADAGDKLVQEEPRRHAGANRKARREGALQRRDRAGAGRAREGAGRPHHAARSLRVPSGAPPSVTAEVPSHEFRSNPPGRPAES